MSDKKPPIKKGNTGGVSWAVWERDGKYGKEYSLTLKNSWKGQDGQWQESPFIPEKAWHHVENIVRSLAVSKFLKKMDEPKQEPRRQPETDHQVDDDLGW